MSFERSMSFILIVFLFREFVRGRDEGDVCPSVLGATPQVPTSLCVAAGPKGGLPLQSA